MLNHSYGKQTQTKSSRREIEGSKRWNQSTRLRGLARKCVDNRQIRRLLSLAAVYDGMNRTEAAKVGGMDRQTLRDWVHRFTEPPPTKVEGFSGLERLRRTVGFFPTEVGGFKPDFWKMNRVLMA